MRFSSLSGTSGGVTRYGRWFVLAFICVALVLVLVPAMSFGATAKVTLCASPSSVVSGGTAKLTAKVCPVPRNATFTLSAKDSAGHITKVATASAGTCGSAVFSVKPMRNTQYQVAVTANGMWPVTSSWVCVKVCAKLTLCVKPGQYCGTTISGTLTPAWNNHQVTITICQYINCWHTMKVATLTATLHQGSGDSSTYAVNWTGKHCTKYTISASVPTTADFKGASVSPCFTL